MSPGLDSFQSVFVGLLSLANLSNRAVCTYTFLLSAAPKPVHTLTAS